MHVHEPRQQGVALELDPARAIGHVGPRDDVDDAIALDQDRTIGHNFAPHGVDDPIGKHCDAFSHGGEDTRGVGAVRADA